MAKNTKRDQSNPILNSPYAAPELHYATNEAGNLNYDDIRDGRRLFTPDTPTIPLAQTQPGKFNVNAAKPSGILVGGDEDRADETALMRAQETSMRRFWKETADDGL